MKFSTKSRYAVMAVVDMGLHSNGKPISLQKISERQNIALNYLEQIFSKLRKECVVSSVKGPGGGYILNKPIQDIQLSVIILAVDGSFKMTRCSQGDKCTPLSGKCATHFIWKGLGKRVLDYFSGISVYDVVKDFEENKISL
jgi:Rrf2 family iron-sulfur cluster assembly transcriptional regulator